MTVVSCVVKASPVTMVCRIEVSSKLKESRSGIKSSLLAGHVERGASLLILLMNISDRVLVLLRVKKHVD